MLQNLLEQLRNAGTGSKVIAGLVLVAVAAIVSTAAVVAQRPHFEMLYSELSASDSALVQKALAGAGIPFEQSQPPGPFIIYVDDADRYKAMHAVAIAGALERTPGGVLPSGGGMTTVFMSAGERQQVTLKREWQETERLLEELNFVTKATVTTTAGIVSAFGRGTPRTGSVMLQVRGAESLSRQQAQTVANLVRFGLGIEPTHLNIADQRGSSLYDGAEFDEAGGGGQWLEQRMQFEERLETRANRVLAAVLGPGAAYVTISSSWNQDINTSVAENADPSKKIVVSEFLDSSKTPQGSQPTVGGAAGPGSNAGEFGVDNAAVPTSSGGGGTADAAKTESTRTEYWTPTETVRTVRLAPVLERLSVSLFLDKNVIAANEDLASIRGDIEDSVKAAVGFDSERNDAFSAVTLPFFAEPVDEEAEAEAAAAEAEQVSEPSPLMEMLLERGVEIVSALAFLFLLLKALKGTPAAAPAAEVSETAESNEGDVMEFLAQAQIEELVKTDPARVGRILSDWVVEEKVGADV